MHTFDHQKYKLESIFYLETVLMSDIQAFYQYKIRLNNTL